MKFLLMAAPLCKDCVHYKPYKYSNFVSSSADCTKVMTTSDLITGDVTYSSASEVRRRQCGPEGRLFEPEPNLLVKKTLHNGFVNLPFILIAVSYTLLLRLVIF